MSVDGLVSIIVPVLNAERYLGEALESIAAQTYPHQEILVVDGGSRDETESIARGFESVRWMRQSGAGLAEAWNTGLDAAAGQFIAFQDSDDRWEPDKLAKQVRYLQEHPQAQYVLGHVRLFVDPGTPIPPGMLPEVFGGSHLGRMPGTLLARRELFEQVGKFDPGFEVTTDVAWFARLDALDIPGGVVPEVLLHKRFHETNYSVTAGARDYAQHLPRMLKQALDLRRGRSAKADQ